MSPEGTVGPGIAECASQGNLSRAASRRPSRWSDIGSPKVASTSGLKSDRASRQPLLPQRAEPRRGIHRERARIAAPAGGRNASQYSRSRAGRRPQAGMQAAGRDRNRGRGCVSHWRGRTPRQFHRRNAQAVAQSESPAGRAQVAGHMKRRARAWASLTGHISNESCPHQRTHRVNRYSSQ